MKLNECKICKEPTGGLFRCEKHYCCDGCGLSKNLCYYTEGLLCNDCHKIRVEKRVIEFDGDTHFQWMIICPYCGMKYNDAFEWDDDGKRECDDCERIFEYERIVTIEYSTKKTTTKEI